MLASPKPYEINFEKQINFFNPSFKPGLVNRAMTDVVNFHMKNMFTISIPKPYVIILKNKQIALV
jgi:hypothetical protein